MGETLNFYLAQSMLLAAYTFCTAISIPSIQGVRYMKHLSIAFIAFCSINADESESSTSKVVYQAQVLPKKVLVPPALYKGVILQQQDGYFFFTDTKKNKLIIAAAPIEIPKTNMVTSLQVPSGKPYVLYTCQKKVIKKNNNTLQYAWEITEERGVGTMSLPEDALVFIVNPEQIEKLTTAQWHKGAVAISVPTLHFTQDAQPDNVRACLASIDMRPFHGKQTTIVKQEGKTVSMQRQTV